MVDKSNTEQIDAIVESHGGWKAETLSQIRSAIMATDVEVVEEVKWKMPSRPLGLPVWSHEGMLCFAEIWKDNVKLLFTKGARMADHQQFFNARLNSADIRAIEFRESDIVDAEVLQTLIREAAKLNEAK